MNRGHPTSSTTSPTNQPEIPPHSLLSSTDITTSFKGVGSGKTGCSYHTIRKRSSRDKMVEESTPVPMSNNSTATYSSKIVIKGIPSSSSGKHLSGAIMDESEVREDISYDDSQLGLDGEDDEEDNYDQNALSDTASLLHSNTILDEMNGNIRRGGDNAHRVGTVLDRIRSSLPSITKHKHSNKQRLSSTGFIGSGAISGNRSRSTSLSNGSLSFSHSPRTIYTSGRPRLLGITNPLTVRWFFSIIGSEYCHIYFWIIKDLAWVQNWRRFSIIFGSLALAWSIVILYHSLRTLNWHEIWNFIASFLWLFANFWWMLGEAHDYEYPDSPPISIQHTYSSSKVLEVALMWCLVYYLIILPFRLLPCNKAALEEYDDGSLKPRFSCFETFRQYENLHMLFWIAKDLAWNRLNLSLWLFCLVPTVLLAIDFIIISATTKCEDSTVDTVHFLSILMWVAGNSVWAYGDFFMEDFSEPMEMWSSTNSGFRNARWYSSWILFSAMVPIALLYIIWVSMTLCNILKPPSQEEDPEFYQEGILDWTPLEGDTDNLFFGDGGGSSSTPGNSSRIGGGTEESVGVDQGVVSQSIDRTASASSLLQLLKTSRSRGTLILQSKTTSEVLEFSPAVGARSILTGSTGSGKDTITEVRDITHEDDGHRLLPTVLSRSGSGKDIEMVDVSSRFQSNITSKISGTSVSGRNRSRGNSSAANGGNSSIASSSSNGVISTDHHRSSPSFPLGTGSIGSTGGSNNGNGSSNLLQRIFYPTLTRSKNSSNELNELAQQHNPSTLNASSSSHGNGSSGLIMDDDEVVEILQQNH